MGRRGPAPMPVKLRELHGEKPYRLVPEPVPRAVGLERPGWLSPEAVAVWAEVEPELSAMGLSHRADSETFGGFCTAAALYARLSAVLPATEGEIRRWRMAACELRAWAREFGLTPAARTGLRASVPAADPHRLLGS